MAGGCSSLLSPLSCCSSLPRAPRSSLSRSPPSLRRRLPPPRSCSMLSLTSGTGCSPSVPPASPSQPAGGQEEAASSVSGGSRIGGALTCCSCQEHGLEYKSVGWWKGNAEILHSLHKAALKARSTKVRMRGLGIRMNGVDEDRALGREFGDGEREGQGWWCSDKTKSMCAKRRGMGGEEDGSGGGHSRRDERGGLRPQELVNTSNMFGEPSRAPAVSRWSPAGGGGTQGEQVGGASIIDN
eukprot:766278-Hanusia_phi.AAC.6